MPHARPHDLRCAGFAVALLAATCLPLSGCQGEEAAVAPSPSTPIAAHAADESPTPSSHNRMVDELKRLAQWSQTNHPILGDGNATKLRARLGLVSAAGWNDPESLNAFLGLHMELGQAELSLGNLDQSITYFSTVVSTLDQLVASGMVEPGLLTQQFLEVKYRLAVAHMRKGETQNCTLHNSPESCLLPIRGTGIHQNPAGSSRAIQYFTDVLRQAPSGSPFFIKARWLPFLVRALVSAWPS